VKEETCDRQADTSESDEHAAEPKGAALGEERDGADDQADFEKRFAAVKAIGAPGDEITFFLQLSGFPADVILVSLIALDFFQVFLAQRRGFFLVLRCERGKQIGDTLRFMKADIFCLIVGPLISRL